MNLLRISVCNECEVKDIWQHPVRQVSGVIHKPRRVRSDVQTSQTTAYIFNSVIAVHMWVSVVSKSIWSLRNNRLPSLLWRESHSLSYTGHIQACCDGLMSFYKLLFRLYWLAGSAQYRMSQQSHDTLTYCGSLDNVYDLFKPKKEDFAAKPYSVQCKEWH